MNLWLVTSLRLAAGEPVRASAIQNIQTAAALAEQGHRVLLWVAEHEGERLLAERLGRPVPEGLRLLSYTPRGPKGEKKTPFSRPLDRWVNFLRARRLVPAPEAILTRSPRAIAQLRQTRLLPPQTRLILEYQYPEWAQLWRQWRRRNPQAGLRECVERLREWRRAEDRWLTQTDGILYAARGHERLLGHIHYPHPAQWLPSGCLPAEGTTAEEALAAQEGAGNKTAAEQYDLGYVGALAPENGLEGLLEALAKLAGARLLLVGGGRAAYRMALERRAAALGVGERVTFAGAIPFAAVRGQMRRCRVGVVPISARQGPEKRQFASPLKLIEWMAAGVPVVAAAVPSVCQQAADGHNALLVPPGEPARLAEALGRLLGEPEQRQRLARSGLAAASLAAYPRRAALITDFIRQLG